MKKIFKKLQNKCNEMAIRAKLALTEKDGEGYIDTAVKIIVGVVIGGVILAGLYALFKNTVIPQMQSGVGGMFDYSGT